MIEPLEMPAHLVRQMPEGQGLADLCREAVRQAKADGAIVPPRMTPSLTEAMLKRIAKKQRRREKETKRAERKERKRLRLEAKAAREAKKKYRARMATAQQRLEI